MVGIKFCECLFIVRHSGRATILYFHKHVSRLETSISRISLVCLMQLHIMKLAALCLRGDICLGKEQKWSYNKIIIQVHIHVPSHQLAFTCIVCAPKPH